MSFKGKEVRVILAGAAKLEFEELNKIVGEEVQKGIEQSDYQTLLRAVNQKIEFLKINPHYGVHIPQDRIPKDYIVKYDVNNLWKVNLAGAWRMIYTIRGSDVEVISFVLDIFNHKDYEKKFGYRGD